MEVEHLLGELVDVGDDENEIVNKGQSLLALVEGDRASQTHACSGVVSQE